MLRDENLPQNVFLDGYGPTAQGDINMQHDGFFNEIHRALQSLLRFRPGYFFHPPLLCGMIDEMCRDRRLFTSARLVSLPSPHSPGTFAGSIGY